MATLRLTRDQLRTTWRVTRITATEGRTVAEMKRVEWFKPNPEYVLLLSDDTYDGDMPDETLDAESGEEGADFFETGEGDLTLTGEFDLHPGQNIIVTLEMAS